MGMRKRTAAGFMVLILSVTILAGCGGGSSGGGTAGAGGAVAGGDTLVMRSEAAPATFDPTQTNLYATFKVLRQIYDGLVSVNNDGSIEMLLAEDYTVNEDNTVYTFQLKQGVKFHNGEELKASDVVFTMDRVMESPHTQHLLDRVESVTALNDYAVEIRFSSPSASFLVSLMQILILNEKAFTEGGQDYSENPVGTGPYRFAANQTGVQVELTRFDEYYGEPVSIKNVIVRIIPDGNTATVALRAGETHFDKISFGAYEEVVNDPNLIISEYDPNQIEFLAVNHEVEPFNDPLVRQALNYAIDREFILDVGCEGLGEIANSMLPGNAIGYSDAIEQNYSYDPEKAKELLDEAGIVTPMNVGTIYCIEGKGQGMTEAIMGNLADIGLQADIQILERNKYFDEVDSGNYQLCTADWGGIDADEYYPLFDAGQINGLNTARYNNPKVAELFNQARSTSDLAERERLYAEAFNQISDDAVYVPLYHLASIVGYNKELKVDVDEIWVQRACKMEWQ